MGSTFSSFAKTRLPSVLASTAEFVALYFWLQHFDSQHYVLATVILLAGLLAARLAVQHWINGNIKSEQGIPPAGKPRREIVLRLLAVSAGKIAVWSIFALTYDGFGIITAFLVLVLGQQIQNTAELALQTRTNWRDLIFSEFAMDMTLPEALGGIAWMYLYWHGQPQPGGLLLLIGLAVKHIAQRTAIEKIAGDLPGGDATPTDPEPGPQDLPPADSAQDSDPATQT